jgi:hypothetical protein
MPMIGNRRSTLPLKRLRLQSRAAARGGSGAFSLPRRLYSRCQFDRNYVTGRAPTWITSEIHVGYQRADVSIELRSRSRAAAPQACAGTSQRDRTCAQASRRSRRTSLRRPLRTPLQRDGPSASRFIWAARQHLFSSTRTFLASRPSYCTHEIISSATIYLKGGELTCQTTQGAKPFGLS